MAHILIRHRVSDYDKWKSVFDGFIEKRRAGGEKSFQIFRGQDEPNNLTLLFEWNSFKNAHTFLAYHRFTNMSALLFINSVLIFLIGLISEQITALNYKDSER